ncbi:hypothetical protein I598_2874 [Isoptericola dokdonensis DS-3]|uniref:Uncharacterized protein n=1 Tax=Isoptericola dokdonensis DS-3 TaxID=1300344 RepID=A0A161HSF0_9MICO|nr:hypothetical protein I598_2874 [Isoptericola dokdonensis DS-3]
MSFWLVTLPVWVVSIALGGAWVAIGVFWSVDSWQATHRGIEGRFIPLVEDCGPKDCHWYGAFESADGAHDVDGVKFSSGFGEPQPEATEAAIDPVVIAPGGSDVYNPHDKTWTFAWIMAALGPFFTWALIAGTSQAREDWLRKGLEPDEQNNQVVETRRRPNATE